MSLTEEYKKLLQKNIPPVADRPYNLRDEVLLYSEQIKRIILPFTIIRSEATMITVQENGKPIRNAIIAFQRKPFSREYEQNLC